MPWLTVPFWSTPKLNFHHVFSGTALNKAQALTGEAVPAEGSGVTAALSSTCCLRSKVGRLDWASVRAHLRQ